jgi:hypothetical protein
MRFPSVVAGFRGTDHTRDTVKVLSSMSIPTLIHVYECWTVVKQRDGQNDTAEMRYYRRTDDIKNQAIMNELDACNILEKNRSTTIEITAPFRNTGKKAALLIVL